ncbi:MAG TPA: delta-60 repeat domain-containing protein, partial [Isosphaeraceae bacterium]|nr:delta-60 repeat domain-containing protein [Isosphaeraceae bacterium]
MPLRPLVAKSVRSSLASKPKRREQRKPALESLEGRTLLSGGQLDQSFGSGGIVTTDLGGTEQANDVALQSDGKIVVVGSTTLNNGDFFVVRYNANGSPDQTFGRSGVVTLDFGGNDSASSVAIQPTDGKIVVAGTTSLGQNFAVARLNTDGSPDASFGRGGIVTTDLGGNDVANSVAIESNRDIIVAGSSNNSFALFEY